MSIPGSTSPMSTTLPLGHLLAAESGRIGRRYILGGENLSARQRSSPRSRELTGRRPPALKIPYAALLPIAAGAEAIARVTGREPFITLDGVRMSKKKMFFQPRRGRCASWAMRRGRRDRRSPTPSPGSRPTVISDDRARRPAQRPVRHPGRQRRDALGQGARRREFPGRLVADPPRSARRMSTPSTALPATPTTSPTTRRWPPTDKLRRLDRMAAILDGAAGDAGRRSGGARRPRRRCARASPPPASPRSIATTCCAPSASMRPSCAIATGTI